ncbi:MAG: nickel pincer cofactor biosynthesis protein LarB [Cyanobacteriota bacterium]|nr:nickel pincer cofactor biosynthesis protein LarB [Cyanobacteriota bacterium]
MSSDHQLDLGRRSRLGMVEAIWGEHKSADQLARIITALHAKGELALATRVSVEKSAAVKRLLNADGSVHYDPQSRCLHTAELPAPDLALGTVTILSGGSSDISVAREAQLALQCHRVRSELMLDVGVAGLHRLLNRLEELRRARVLIACAGMEGALPTVLAGLLPQPVIGVPVSVGYGVSAGGQAALTGMLASCAPGLCVVNIDNGYGAAMAALRILNSGAGAAAP